MVDNTIVTYYGSAVKLAIDLCNIDKWLLSGRYQELQARSDEAKRVNKLSKTLHDSLRQELRIDMSE
jgi:hypothetical protein